MKKRTGIWRFSVPLRVTALITALFYGPLFVVIWVMAWTGHTEAAFDFVDVTSSAPLTALQKVGGMFCSGMAVGALVLISITSNNFLKTTHKDGFFEASVSRTLKHLGYGLIMFYAGLMLWENFMPWLMTKNLAPDLQEEINWILLDLNIVALLVGVVLLLLSGAIDEAREIDADNKQII